MSHLRRMLLFAVLIAPLAVRAEDVRSDPGSEPATSDADARALMEDALEKQATLPATPPTLPDAASDQARNATEQKAFRRTGEVRRRAGEAVLERLDPETSAKNGTTRRPQPNGNATAQEAANRQRAKAAKSRTDHPSGPPAPPPRR